MKEFLRFKLKGCPACIDSQPAWNQFKRSCEGRLAPKCRLKEVDSENAGAYSFQVDSFPTYMVVIDGVPSPYEGSREAAALEKHVQKKGFLKRVTRNRSRRTPNSGKRRSKFRK